MLLITRVPSLKAMPVRSGSLLSTPRIFPRGLIDRFEQLKRHREEGRAQQTVARAACPMAGRRELRFNRIHDPHALPVFGQEAIEREQCVAVFS